VDKFSQTDRNLDYRSIGIASKFCWKEAKKVKVCFVVCSWGEYVTLIPWKYTLWIQIYPRIVLYVAPTFILIPSSEVCAGDEAYHCRMM